VSIFSRSGDQNTEVFSGGKEMNVYAEIEKIIKSGVIDDCQRITYYRELDNSIIPVGHYNNAEPDSCYAEDSQMHPFFSNWEPVIQWSLPGSIDTFLRSFLASDERLNVVLTVLNIYCKYGKERALQELAGLEKIEGKKKKILAKLQELY
jgi:hypothetical protein